MLAKTAESGAREIQLIAAQDEIVKPSRIFTAQALGSAGAEPDTPAIAPSEAPPLSHDDYVVGPIGVPSVFHVDRLDLSFVPKPWAWAEKRRAEIDALFADMRRKKPALWNGRVLLMHRQVIEHGVLRGEFIETDYASFIRLEASGPAAGGGARLLQRRGDPELRWRISPRRHGRAHVQCRQGLFSVRHARSG